VEPQEKNVTDEFMLKEYENIASAHFDSQNGLRQQFRFYLLISAVPLTVLGFTFKLETDIQHIGLFDLPKLLAAAFFGIGFLGLLMLLSMIHTALDATLYARTVNGIRRYFVDRATAGGTTLNPYLKMPIALDRPRYFHIRAFFWQVILVSAVNTAYMEVGVRNYTKSCVATSGVILLFIVQLGAYFVFSWVRERKEISG
jgi:hypothetical protein